MSSGLGIRGEGLRHTGIVLGLIVLCGWLGGSLLVRGDAIQPADAIVVIGGDHKPERVARAVELYQQGYAPVVIISAGTLVAEGQEVLAEAKVMERQAVALGLPKSVIILEDQSQSTFQNAYFTSILCQEGGYNSIILVTSTFHSRRAGQIFREVYGEAVSIFVQPAPPNACAICWPLQPHQWDVVAYEYYNWARYWLDLRLPNEAPPNE